MIKIYNKPLGELNYFPLNYNNPDAFGLPAAPYGFDLHYYYTKTKLVCVDSRGQVFDKGPLLLPDGTEGFEDSGDWICPEIVTAVKRPDGSNLIIGVIKYFSDALSKLICQTFYYIQDPSGNGYLATPTLLDTGVTDPVYILGSPSYSIPSAVVKSDGTVYVLQNVFDTAQTTFYSIVWKITTSGTVTRILSLSVATTYADGGFYRGLSIAANDDIILWGTEVVSSSFLRPSYKVIRNDTVLSTNRITTLEGVFSAFFQRNDGTWITVVQQFQNTGGTVWQAVAGVDMKFFTISSTYGTPTQFTLLNGSGSPIPTTTISTTQLDKFSVNVSQAGTSGPIVMSLDMSNGTATSYTSPIKQFIKLSNSLVATTYSPSLVDTSVGGLIGPIRMSRVGNLGVSFACTGVNAAATSNIVKTYFINSSGNIASSNNITVTLPAGEFGAVSSASSSNYCIITLATDSFVNMKNTPYYSIASSPHLLRYDVDTNVLSRIVTPWDETTWDVSVYNLRTTSW